MTPSTVSKVEVHSSGDDRRPDISVIVPAYNAEPWITETLRSVLAQTIDPASYEIIVVDNGSEDRTLDVAAAALRMASVRFSLGSEPQRGQSDARNHGLRLARGNWIQFLDADDLLHPDKLLTQLNFAQTCDSDVGLIYSEWQDLDQQIKTAWMKGAPILPDLDNTATVALVRSLINDAGFIPTGSQLFRRSALVDVEGYKSVGLIEDVDLYIRLATAGWRFACCPSSEPFFLYRRHRDRSLSRGGILAFADGVVRNAALVESWARAHQMLDQSLSSQVIASYFQAARMFAGRDWARFDAVVERIRKLDGVVIPPSPWALTTLSQLTGYKAAERVAFWWRRFKRFTSVGQGRQRSSLKEFRRF
jgi:glycosyltransferase involved in cell wall biosynthesis